MNIRTLFAKCTSDLNSLVGKITAGTEKLIPRISQMVDVVEAIAVKVEGEIPVILADLNSPMGNAIAEYLPDGEAAKAAIIAIINRFQPYIQKAADPAIMNALKLRLTSEILFIEHGAIATIDKAILDVQHFFQEA